MTSAYTSLINITHKLRVKVLNSIDYLHQLQYISNKLLIRTICHLYAVVYSFLTIHILPFSNVHHSLPWRLVETPSLRIAFVSVCCLAAPKTKPVEFAARAGCTGRAAEATWDT